MADSGAVKIGSKSGYTQRGVANPDFGRQRRRTARARPPAIIVDVKTCGEVVGEVDLITLVRFSTLAAEVFPKPATKGHNGIPVPPSDEGRTSSPTADVSPVTTSSTESTVHALPSTIGSSPTPTKQHDGSSTLKLKFPITIQSHSQTIKPTHAPSSQIAAPAPIIKERRLLDLDQYAIWDAPSPEAVRYVLAWMLKAKSTPRSGKPLPCSVPNPPPASLAVDDIRPYHPFLCELYSALLILRVRPTQNHARQDLMNNISTTVPTLAMLKHIHSLVPVGDSVMTRTINSYFDRVNAIPYLADEAEVAAIHRYVMHESLDEDLEAQFRRMQTRRVGRKFAERRREAKERKGGQDWKGYQKYSRHRVRTGNC